MLIDVYVGVGGVSRTDPSLFREHKILSFVHTVKVPSSLVNSTVLKPVDITVFKPKYLFCKIWIVESVESINYMSTNWYRIL